MDWKKPVTIVLDGKAVVVKKFGYAFFSYDPRNPDAIGDFLIEAKHVTHVEQNID